MFYAQNLISISRRNFLIAFTILLFLVLDIRLYNLQISRHQEYLKLANANRIRVIRKEPPRGLIFDRNGNLLVDNQSLYTVSVIPWEIKKSPESGKLLCQILSIDYDKFLKRIKEESKGNFVPLRIKSGIPFRILSLIEEHRLELPGVIYSFDPVRRYSTEVNLSHVLGYLREVDSEYLERNPDERYHAGDLVGWQGIEKKYERILRGKPGYEYDQVDALGRVIGEVPDMSPIHPEPGHDLYLTIDLELQKRAEELLEGESGALVLLDSQNGEVLALTSKPDYRLELFAGVIDKARWDALVSDSTRPLFNRFLQGGYPPGSIFKLVTAILALNNKIIDENWTIFCPGYYKLGRRVFNCWKPGGHGKVNLYRAIEQSCNVFFFNLIRLINLDDWAQMARQFGFGSLTGIDLDEESRGLLPDARYMDRKYGKGGWTEGNKLNLVVGQGDLLVTPIQVAKFAMIIDQHGYYSTPHLALKYVNKRANQTMRFVAHRDSVSGINEEVWDKIEAAMRMVVEGKNGTARLARVSGAEVLGKTGTAQNPHGESHSWFMGVLRTVKGRYAIAVVVEHGGSGGGKAASIAGNIFRFIARRDSRIQVAKIDG